MWFGLQTVSQDTKFEIMSVLGGTCRDKFECKTMVRTWTTSVRVVLVKSLTPIL